MDFSSIIGGIMSNSGGSGGAGGIMGMATNLIGSLTKQGAPAPAAPAPAAQQPSVFAQNQASQGTVKMEIPVQLAGTVANVINANC
ncbi:MAG TPA: hypothetical protein DDW90_00130 [Cyanobacteria bacterium UBA9971]|nr:hypothetical protein [Cyanobacteria bacterium UBA9971]